MAPERFVTSDDVLRMLERVVWNSYALLPGVVDFLSFLRSKGKALLFATNSAARSRVEIKAKFDRLGIECQLDEIICSAYAAAIYLKHIFKMPGEKYAYVLGAEGIETELDTVGIKRKGGLDPADHIIGTEEAITAIEADQSIGAVVCGFDVQINYLKYAKATRYLRDNEDCQLVITHEDVVYPAGEELLYPTIGALSAVLRAAAPNAHAITIGKPHRPMGDAIAATHSIDSARTLMIGDTLETDILFAKRNVRTGVSSMHDLERTPLEAQPDYLAGGIDTLALLCTT